MRKAWMLVVAGVGAMLVAAGCGGDDDEEATATATTGATGATGAAGGGPLSRGEFIEQADQICARGDNQIEREAAQTFGDQEPSEQEIERFAADTVAPNIQDQVDQLRQLTPPEGDEQEVSEILDAAQDGIDAVEDDPGALNEGEDAGGGFTEANSLATAYGMKACGGG